MKRNVLNSVRAATPIVLAVLALGTAPVAASGNYPGSKMTFTSGAGNTHSLFTVSGNGITVTGDTLGVNTYLLDGTQLVGLRSIYLVKTDGSATSGISTMTNGGFSSITSSSSTVNNYNGNPDFNGYTGYDDAGPGNGFSNGSNWVVIADPALAGKMASNKNTYGSFTFSAPISGNDIGLDYILKGGSTGRAYFALPATRVPAAVPEPGSLASLALGSLGLGVLVLRARKRSVKAA